MGPAPMLPDIAGPGLFSSDQLGSGNLRLRKVLESLAGERLCHLGDVSTFQRYRDVTMVTMMRNTKSRDTFLTTTLTRHALIRVVSC